MKKTAFKPILGDLSKLTPEQQQDYVIRACDYLDVPNDLGLVELIWLDSGDGARNLVLYLKRGATDIIRGNRGINVVSLTPANGDGFVAWIAAGKDSSGRQEMAIGSASIKGLSGQAIATAVMLAQTRALRRMTLQFAGGGFLDETEIVNEKTTNIATVSSLSQIAQPTSPINTQAGTDTTLTEAVEKPKERRRRKTVSLDSDASETPITSPSEQLQAELEPLPETSLVLNPEQADTFIQKLLNPPEPNDVAKAAAVKYSEVIEEKPFIGTKPTNAQKDEYRKRLSKLINDILKPNGLLQSEKSGSVHNKIKLFFLAMFPKLEDVKQASIENWVYFYDWIDKKLAEEDGTKKLVAFIDKTIGEVK